jgi:hypothetical protein
MKDYWEECIAEALEDAKVSATGDQIAIIAGWVEGAHENYGMAHGYDSIPNPMISEIEMLKADHRRYIAEKDCQIECFRRSVARRRNVDISDVYLDGGDVMVRG